MEEKEKRESFYFLQRDRRKSGADDRKRVCCDHMSDHMFHLLPFAYETGLLHLLLKRKDYYVFKFRADGEV